MKVFLSHSFARDDDDLVQCLERLLSSHDVLVVRGRRLAGGQVTPEVRRLIDGSDGLVALMTRRDPLGDPSQNRWRSSPWIDYEYMHARDREKHAIALVENGVEDGGPNQGFEKIPFDRADLLEAFLALSETLRIWKERIGIPRVVQIRPDHIGRDFRINRDLKCRYRFVSGQGVRGQWVEAEPVLQPSGTLLYLNGVQGDDTLIEIEILQQESPRWWSPATSQFISIEMRAWEDGQ
jgi:hypothetical protein